jgi:hypothetical protein
MPIAPTKRATIFLIMLADSPKRKVYGDYDRRWISDDYFDLIVWYTRKGAIYGFQLCYDKPHWERALTWRKDRGFSHTAIESGEEDAMKNLTPILVPDGSFPATKVKREFRRRARLLPQELRELVVSKIAEFEVERKQ